MMVNSIGRHSAPTSTPSMPCVGGPELTYMLSSQARNWRFSARQIEKMRSEGNEMAVKRIAGLWEEERSLPLVEGEPEASSSSGPIDFLTVDEEQSLIAYYLTRVRQLVKAFSLHELVEATTVTFIKRFYLRNTCMDFHPKNIMLTCLFLAAKAESNAVPLRHFATKLAGKNPSQAAIAEYTKIVQDLEFLISQSLAFEYAVHGAHRSLHGVFLDLQTLQPRPSTETLSMILGPARAQVQQSRLTDAELIYTPAQIAMACVRSASEEGKRLVSLYLEQKEHRAREAKRQQREQREAWRATERQRLEKKGIKAEEIPNGLHAAAEEEEEKDIEAPLGMNRKEIDHTLQEICQMINASADKGVSDVEKVKEIDKKLKSCQNPERVPSSRLAQKSEAEKNAAVLGKRDAARVKKGEANPFLDEDDDDDDDDVDDDDGAASIPNKRIKTRSNGNAKA